MWRYDCIADLSHKIDEPEQADHWRRCTAGAIFAKPATNILLKLNDQLKLRTIVSGLSYKLSKQTILWWPLLLHKACRAYANSITETTMTQTVLLALKELCSVRECCERWAHSSTYWHQLQGVRITKSVCGKITHCYVCQEQISLGMS